eukprot:9112582-Pyramimonas_sp.AAC.1
MQSRIACTRCDASCAAWTARPPLRMTQTTTTTSEVAATQVAQDGAERDRGGPTDGPGDDADEGD